MKNQSRTDTDLGRGALTDLLSPVLEHEAGEHQGEEEESTDRMLFRMNLNSIRLISNHLE